MDETLRDATFTAKHEETLKSIFGDHTCSNPSENPKVAIDKNWTTGECWFDQPRIIG